jgi:hypothetical protein
VPWSNGVGGVKAGPQKLRPLAMPRPNDPGTPLTALSYVQFGEASYLYIRNIMPIGTRLPRRRPWPIGPRLSAFHESALQFLKILSEFLYLRRNLPTEHFSCRFMCV